MKILSLKRETSLAKFKIDEYTYPMGSIIFDGSKGGDISNSYSFRFCSGNENDEKKIGRKSSKGIITFYIDKVTKHFKHIDFIALSGFKVEKTQVKLERKSTNETPVIDISTWVSPYGSLSGMPYDDTRYLHLEDHIDVQIKHNGLDIIKFSFGKVARQIQLNDSLFIEIDDLNNLSSLIIFDQEEVPKLIRQLLT